MYCFLLYCMVMVPFVNAWRIDYKVRIQDLAKRYKWHLMFSTKSHILFDSFFCSIHYCIRISRDSTMMSRVFCTICATFICQLQISNIPWRIFALNLLARIASWYVVAFSLVLSSSKYRKSVSTCNHYCDVDRAGSTVLITTYLHGYSSLNVVGGEGKDVATRATIEQLMTLANSRSRLLRYRNCET